MDEQQPVVDPVAEAAKLPLSERVAHKHWKVREAAYRELADKFRISPDDSKIYADFLTSLGKIARDANAPAQLAGFEALSSYADTAAPQQVRRVATDIVKGIVEKGLSGRPTNRKKAVDTILMFVGADAGDLAVEAVVANGFKHRTPKIVVACVECLTQAVDTYGTGPVPAKTIASRLGPLLDHSQEAVRTAAKALVVMLNRWVGNAIKPVLKEAKEVIVKEMETAFAQNANEGRPKPKKLTRSMEQRARRTGVAADDVDENDGFGEVEEEEEELDLAEEINLLEKLGKIKIEIEEGVRKDWYTAIDSKKWNVRKNALDTAIETIGDARLTPGAHQEVFTRLRKILAKDSNVNVVASSAKLIKAMAGGLKKTFPPNTAKVLTVDLLGRLKEKNRIVVDAVCAALDALHEKKCIRIVELLDEVTAAASHKVPKARCQLFLWVGRCLLSGISGADLKGAPLKCFGTLCLKASEDSAPEVRDAGLGGLAALQKIVGERNVAAYVEKLDKKRKDKVAAMMEKLPEPAKAAKTTKSSGPAANTRSQATKKKASSSPKQAAAARKASSPKRQKPKPKQVAPVGSDDEGEASHSPGDALTAAVERFPGFEAENWSVKSFKTRAAAVGIITTALAEKEAFDDQDVSIVLGLLQCEPGLSDSNFVAVKPKLELFGMVAEKCASPPPRKTLRPLLINALEKLGDIKSAKMTAGILTNHVEATSPRFFFELILHSVRETKNSRALIGMLKFAASIVEDFGVPSPSEPYLASMATETMINPAPAAKNAAVVLACKAANRIGSDKFRDLMKQKGAQDEVLEAFGKELAKYSREPDPPTKKKRFDIPSGPQDGDDRDQEEAPPNDPSPMAAEVEVNGARQDVSSDFAEANTSGVETAAGEPKRVSVAHEFAPGARILLELKNSNWKKRQEALEFVERVVENARDCIMPSIGMEIIAALRARLNDSNRNLATLAYTVVNRVMQAMGPGGAVHLKVMAPGVLGQGCIDIKKTVRDSAMKCLDGWFQSYGLSALLPYIHLPFASLNSGIRKEYLEWLVPRLQGEIGQFDAGEEDLSILVDPCLVCLRDRTVEVRHFADLTLEQVIRSVGISTVDGKVSSLTKSVQLQLEPVLDKYRGAPGTERVQEAKTTPRTTGNATPRTGRQRPHSVALPRTPLHRRGMGAGGEESTPTAGSRRPRPASVRVTPVASSGRPQGTPVRDLSPLLKPNNGRDLRAQRFTNKRMYFQEELADSNPSDVPPLIREELQDLAGDLSECCSTELYAKLMAPPNRFRMHVEAIDMVRSQLEETPDSLLSVADVLLRWAACRIEDSKTPPTVLVKLAAFVSNICEILISSEVKLGEYEASAILPPVIEKTGSTRVTVRDAMRGALMSVCDIVDDDVLLILFSSCLRQPFNANALSEISHEICRLLDKRCVAGAGIPPGVLPSIGRIAGGEDDTAGKAAAECLEKAHAYFGDDLWTLVGDLNSQEAACLDERLTSAIKSVRQEMTMSSQDMNNPVSAGTGLSTPVRTPGPGDIRNEDFRLSVAPAPPSGVLTSISDSLNMATPTPVKTRSQAGRTNISETPALPNRIFGVSREMDAKEDAANDILLRLKSSDRDLQLSGLASIFEDLKRDAYLLRSSVGAEILLQLVHCFGDTLERLESIVALDDDPAVLKSFLKGVIRFAREPELLCRLDQNAVEVLLSDALNAMIPQSVEGVEDWDQVRRGVNLMIVKILESCDQNLLFTAMINLLLKNIRLMQRSGEDKVSALAKSSICIKSIAKVAKRGFRECRINALLRDIHLFLMANPVRKDGTASAEDQTFAMRLLKTVVNAIIDEIGEEIRTKLDLIPQAEKSQLVHYVEMTLTGRDTSADLSVREHSANAVDTRGNVRVQEALSKIDPLAGSEEELQKLRAVLISYPEVDINSHLLNCSPEVRKYISTGLARFREEANKVYYHAIQQNEDNSQPPPVREGGLSDALSHTNSTSGTAGQVYLKRLHEIQLRYGLQSNSKTASEDHASPAVIEKENGAIEAEAPGEDARGKASSLRERMARIRELQAAAKQ